MPSVESVWVILWYYTKLKENSKEQQLSIQIVVVTSFRLEVEEEQNS